MHRCTWAERDPVLREYHDTEWGVPETDGRARWEKRMLDGFQAGLAGGKPLQTRSAIPTRSPLSEEISKALKKRGFKFVGPVIVYAWMQAVGIVNDHAANCFRHRPVRALASTRARAIR